MSAIINGGGSYKPNSSPTRHDAAKSDRAFVPFWNQFAPAAKSRISEMAQFYANSNRPHGERALTEWVDAVRKRWPDATQAERLAAHRMAETIREGVR